MRFFFPKLVIFSIALLLVLGLGNTIEAQETEGKQIYINVKFVNPTKTPDKYLIAFEGCTGNQYVRVDDFFIVSDVEQVSLIQFAEVDKVLPPKICRLLKINIEAEDVDSIKFIIPNINFEHKIISEVIRKTTGTLTSDTQSEIAVRYSDLSYRTNMLSEDDVLQCETVHDDFLNLNERQFSIRYLYHPFMGDCVMLFNDHMWGITGDNRFAKLSDRHQTLRTESEFIRNQVPMHGITITKKSTIEGQISETFIVTFEICSKNKFVNIDDVLIASDKDIIRTVFEKAEKGRIISPGSCRIFEYQIQADDPNSIRILIPQMAKKSIVSETITGKHMIGDQSLGMDTKHMSPHAQMRHGITVDKITCNEGLQLMKKLSDGMPACVSQDAASKLAERGWGIPLN